MATYSVDIEEKNNLILLCLVLFSDIRQYCNQTDWQRSLWFREHRCYPGWSMYKGSDVCLPICAPGTGKMLGGWWPIWAVNFRCAHLVLLTMSLFPILQLLARQDALRERAATRRRLLEDSLLLQKLYQDSDDLKNWINKKKKLTDDEDYKVHKVFQSCLYSFRDRFMELESWSWKDHNILLVSLIFRLRNRVSEKSNDFLKAIYLVKNQECSFLSFYSLLPITPFLWHSFQCCLIERGKEGTTPYLVTCCLFITSSAPLCTLTVEKYFLILMYIHIYWKLHVNKK